MAPLKGRVWEAIQIRHNWFTFEYLKIGMAGCGKSKVEAIPLPTPIVYRPLFIYIFKLQLPALWIVRRKYALMKVLLSQYQTIYSTSQLTLFNILLSPHKAARRLRIKKDMLKLVPPPVIAKDSCKCRYCQQVEFKQFVSDGMAVTQAIAEPEEGQYASRVLRDWESLQRERLKESRREVLRSDEMRDAMVSHLTGFIKDMNALTKRGVTWTPSTREEVRKSPHPTSVGGTSNLSDAGGQSSSSSVRSEGGQSLVPTVRNEGVEPSNQTQYGPSLALRINNKVIRLRPLRPRV